MYPNVLQNFWSLKLECSRVKGKKINNSNDKNLLINKKINIISREALIKENLNYKSLFESQKSLNEEEELIKKIEDMRRDM